MPGPSIEELLGQLSGQEMDVNAPRFNRGTTDAMVGMGHPQSGGWDEIMAKIPPDTLAAAQRSSGIVTPTTDGERMYLAAAALQIMEGGDPNNDPVGVPDAMSEDGTGLWDAAHVGNRKGSSFIGQEDGSFSAADPVGNGPRQMGGSLDAIRAKVLGTVNNEELPHPLDPEFRKILDSIPGDAILKAKADLGLENPGTDGEITAVTKRALEIMDGTGSAAELMMKPVGDPLKPERSVKQDVLKQVTGKK